MPFVDSLPFDLGFIHVYYMRSYKVLSLPNYAMILPTYGSLTEKNLWGSHWSVQVKA
jgi:hypothetical protein